MITFNYKKYRPFNPVEYVVPDNSPAVEDFQDLQVKTLPNWLVVNNLTRFNDNNQYKYDASVNQSVANTLSPGIYNGQLVITGTLVAVFRRGFTQKTDYTLVVLDTVQLSISPSVFVFEAVLGESNNNTSPLRITSENSWNAATTDSWITLTQTNGVGNGLLRVGVDTNGLSAGNYNGTIVINDGFGSITAQVTLKVQGVQNENDFLKVRPGSLDFVEKVGEPSVKAKSLELESSENYNVAKNQSWINLSATSGFDGFSQVVVTTDIDSLPIGVYQGVITITSGDFVENVYVTLRVTDVTIQGIESNGFFYADDRNQLMITSSQDNTIADIDFEAYAENRITPFNKKIPFFRASATIFIGLETRNLLRPMMLRQLPGSKVISSYIPISYNFTVQEKQRFISQSIIRESYSNVRFINGKTPEIANRLTYLPAKITTTKDALIAISLLNDQILDEIIITGAVEQTITNSGIFITPVQTALIDLSDYPSLVPGDRINITTSGQSVDVLIKASEPEHTILAFENEWNLPEYFMLTGQLSITTKKGWLTSLQSLDGKERTYIFDAKKPVDFKVNTGWIYSQDEVDWLGKIFDSKLFYLIIDGEYIEVIPTISRFENRRTRKNLVSFDLTFTKAIV